MPSYRNAILVAATTCVGTLALVATVNVSCGTVVPQACAADCPDLTTLQADIVTLQADIAALQGKVKLVEDSATSLHTALSPVVFLAYLETAQTVTTATDTLVLFDHVIVGQESFDLTTHEYKAPAAGQYIITSTVSYSGMDKGRGNNEIWITKANQTTAISQSLVTVPGNASGIGSTLLRVNSADVVQLDPGDRVSIRAFHDSGLDKLLNVGVKETSLQIIRIPSEI
jgi:hypothetical protein